MQDTSSPQGRRRYRQLSLRGALLAMSLFGFGLATQVWLYQSERRAAEQVAATCDAEFNWSQPSWCTWFVGTGDVSIFSRVAAVSIEDEALGDEGILALPLDELNSLQTVSIACPRVSDAATTKLSYRLSDVTIETVVFEAELVDVGDISTIQCIGCLAYDDETVVLPDAEHQAE